MLTIQLAKLSCVRMIRYTHGTMLNDIREAKIASRALGWVQENWIVCLFLLLFALFRIYTVFNFNPYWGYDGGGHIDYIYSIAAGEMPSIENNYIAWHEPLYYFLQGGVLRVSMLFTESIDIQLKTLGVVQVLMSIVSLLLIYGIAKMVTKNRYAQVGSVVLLAFLTAFSQVSTFLTNELLNYLLIFLLIWMYQRWKGKFTRWQYLALGIVGGLALLNKITAIVAICVVGFFIVVNWVKTKERLAPLYLGLLLIPILLMQIPWQIYRVNHIYETPTINNPHFLPPAELTLDSRIWFFTKFDMDIFEFPYWYSGGRAFWSMIYADTFYDYYGSLVNKDWLEQATEDQLTLTTHSPTYVSTTKAELTKKLPYLAFFPLAVFFLGIAAMLRKKAWFELSLTAGFLAALLYFSYRYPFYDYGIVKSIFIFPVYLFPTIYGFKTVFGAIERKGWRRFAALLLLIGTGVYLAFLIPTLTISPYGY